MTARVILNPYANRWNAQKRSAEVETALHAAGIDFDILVTDRPGHGTLLAAEAVRAGCSPIIAAGGDGSIGEVVNGMLQAAGDDAPPPLGLLPLGSANDLTDNLKLPRDLNASAKIIAAGNVKWMDVCTVNGRYFVNNSAVGLEPCITVIQQNIHRVKGTLRYLVATVRGVLDNPQFQARLEWEGGSYNGPVTLVTVGNHPRTGGLFYTTPHADAWDGQLTFVHGYMPTRGAILKLLPRTMKAGEGSYVEHPAIHEINSPWLKVHLEPASPMHADGELQTLGLNDVEYRVLAARMPVLLPGN